jgi:tetratricopeptide (TPR) repeat protein
MVNSLQLPEIRPAAAAIVVGIATAGAAILFSTAPALSQTPAIRPHSRETAALLRDADKALAEGQTKNALQLTKQALALEANSAELHNELGLCQVQLKEFDQAAQAFKAAVDHAPDYEPGWQNLGAILYRQRNYDQAIDCFSKALQLNGKPAADELISIADAYCDRAHFQDAANAQQSDLDKALEYYKEALAVAPEQASVHNHLGVFYYQCNNLQSAEDEIKQAIMLQNDYAAAYYNLALVEQKLHKLPEAAQALQDSLRYEPNPKYQQQARQKLSEFGISADSGNYLTSSYELLSHSDWVGAEHILQLAVHGKGSADAVAYNNLGYALARQGKFANAIAFYHQALNLRSGDFPEAQYNLGQALRRTGDLAGARKSLRQAVVTAGGMNAPAHIALGLVYRQQNNLGQAASEYKLAIMQSGDTLPVAHFNLALTLEKDAGKRADAINEYELYLRQAPNGSNAATARARRAALKQ